MADAESDPRKQSLPASLQVLGHVLQKGFQAGGVVAGALVIPATASYTGLYQKAPVSVLQLVRTAGVSCLAGIGLTALLGAAKLSQLDEEGMVDRAYRLHFNESQRRTDMFAAVGSGMGLAAGALLLRSHPGVGAVHYLGTAGLGAAGGVLLHVLTRPDEHKTPDKMLHEALNT